MSEYVRLRMPPSAPELSRKAAIVGIGESDFRADYQAERARAPGYESPTPEALALKAFERALADSGLSRDDIDGVSCSFTYGGPEPLEMARILGVEAPRYAQTNGNIMAGPLPAVCADIAAGKADTVAMIYAVASRAIGRQYGGNTYAGDHGEDDATPTSYYYHLPWGFSSQAAHWALMFSHYQAAYGATEVDLGAVALQLRANAARNPIAVMQAPLTIEQYLASRYIVRPLHLFDLCIVNDGAVCLIVQRADLAKQRAQVPIEVAGWGEAKIKYNKMQIMVRDRLRPIIQEAGAQAFAMAGLAPADVDHFEAYDVSSIHLINQVEGMGWAEPGKGLAFCRDGGMAVGGRMPTNTGGGNLSGSYQHGWSQITEIVRQLRGQAEGRQVKDADVSMFVLTQTDQSHPILLARGE